MSIYAFSKLEGQLSIVTCNQTAETSNKIGGHSQLFEPYSQKSEESISGRFRSPWVPPALSSAFEKKRGQK